MAEVLNLCTFEPSVVPWCFYDWYTLEELIFNLNDDSFNETLSKIKEYLPENKNTLYCLIIAAAAVRRFNFKLYYDLCRVLGPTNNVYKLSPFSFLLNEKGLISPNQKQLFEKWHSMKGRSQEIIEIFDASSIFNCIVSDDIDVFIYHFFQKDFSGKVIEIDNNFGSKFTLTFTVDAFAAWFSAFKIFKFLTIMDSIVINKKLLQAVVEGGNFEIMKLCINKGAEFGECFTYAVAYHRHKICKYLLENY